MDQASPPPAPHVKVPAAPLALPAPPVQVPAITDRPLQEPPAKRAKVPKAAQPTKYQDEQDDEAVPSEVEPATDSNAEQAKDILQKAAQILKDHHMQKAARHLRKLRYFI